MIAGYKWMWEYLFRDEIMEKIKTNKNVQEWSSLQERSESRVKISGEKS